LCDDVEDEEADARVSLDSRDTVHEEADWYVHDAVDASVAVRVLVKSIRQLPSRNFGTQISCKSGRGDHLLYDFFIRQQYRSLPQRPGLIMLVVGGYTNSVPLPMHLCLKHTIQVALITAAWFVWGEP
jgi:hypothetical protein